MAQHPVFIIHYLFYTTIIESSPEIIPTYVCKLKLHAPRVLGGECARRIDSPRSKLRGNEFLSSAKPMRSQDSKNLINEYALQIL